MCLVCEKVDEKLVEIERNENSFDSLESLAQELFQEFRIKEKAREKNISAFISRKNELVSKARLNGLLVGSTMVKDEPCELDQTPIKPRASRAICSVDKASYGKRSPFGFSF